MHPVTNAFYSLSNAIKNQLRSLTLPQQKVALFAIPLLAIASTLSLWVYRKINRYPLQITKQNNLFKEDKRQPIGNKDSQKVTEESKFEKQTKDNGDHNQTKNFQIEQITVINKVPIDDKAKEKETQNEKRDDEQLIENKDLQNDAYPDKTIVRETKKTEEKPSNDNFNISSPPTIIITPPDDEPTEHVPESGNKKRNLEEKKIKKIKKKEENTTFLENFLATALKEQIQINEQSLIGKQEEEKNKILDNNSKKPEVVKVIENDQDKKKDNTILTNGRSEVALKQKKLIDDTVTIWRILAKEIKRDSQDFPLGWSVADDEVLGKFQKWCEDNKEALSKVKKLDLSAKGLNSVPQAINLLTSLKKLDLCNNSLVTFPTEMPKSLTAINLMYNELRSIPDNFFENCRDLKDLNLSHNRLSTLPTALGKCTKVKFLYLNNNYLKEVQKIETLQELRILRVSHNQLNQLPSAIFGFKELNEIFADNNLLVEGETIQIKEWGKGKSGRKISVDKLN